MGIVDFQAGLNNDLRGQMMARMQAALEQRNFAENQRRARFGEGMQEKTFQSNEELKRAQMDATEELRKQTQQNQAITQAGALAEQIPAGAFLGESSPSVGMLRTGGRGDLLQPQDERPEVAEGPLLPGDTGAYKPKGFIKTASANQQNVIADNERAAAQGKAQAEAAAASTARDSARDSETIRHNKAMESKPTHDKLTKVEHKDPMTGRTVIEYLPESEVRGKSYEKGTGVAAEGRLASAQAVNQTGEDIIAQISDPTVAAMLGPSMGRYGTLREFIGNPPPEMAELAGAIESYAIANMGVHGMRSVQGAEQVKKLLDKKHTPESLKATIKGLSRFSQHFMENEGRGTDGSGRKLASGNNADPLGLR